MDDLIRWFILGILVLTIGTSGAYRSRAAKRSGTIERGSESGFLKATRAAVALPSFLGLLVYLVNPAWMAWASVDLPAGLRWAGVGLAAAATPLTAWVLGSLGDSVSATIFTKEGQQLVTRGPYRWVRHPFYSTGMLMWTGVSLAAANLYFAFFVVLTIIVWDRVIIPREEAELVVRFGEGYRAYMRGTGRWLPRHLKGSL